MSVRLSHRFAAAASVAAPAWIVLAALVPVAALTPAAALFGGVAALAIAFLVVAPHLADLARLTAQAHRLAAEDEAGPSPERPPAPRTILAADLTVALARARRRIAAAHQAMEARAAGAEAVVDGVPEPLLVLDRRRQIVHANLAAETHLGTDLAGRDLATVLRHPGILDAVAATLADGRSRALDVELGLPTERAPVERFLRARIAPLPHWSGDALILTLEDQTSIRRSEQMKVDFVANVSHELKTPLATLLGFIETLQGPARDDAEARDRFLGIMQDQATRMRRIVEDLLSLSRIELEEHNPPTGSVDVLELVRSVAETLELVAARRGMTIAVEESGRLPAVAGDEDQLAQVFTNLMENALKYARQGTVVRVEARGAAVPGGPPVDRDPRYVAISVHDEGEGIPRRHLARLTERFYRVDRARSRDLGGTGLGLAIVKHIVNRHRGALHIDSTPGQGSRFTVFLPVQPRNGSARP